MSIVLNVSGIQKRYESGFTLGPLDFKLEQGYIIAVVGPNGSGKSTLIKMLMNMITPDQGTFNLLGQKYPQDGITIKQQIGYVPELTHWDDSWVKVKDVIQFYSHWFPTWNAKLLAALMHRFSLSAELPFKGMSKGVQRKLSLVLAMAHEPSLLLLDEPSSGLDPFAARTMVTEIQRYMEEGSKSVFMATHIMDEVKKLADYVLFLSYGKQLGLYEKDALIDEWKAIWAEQLPERPDAIPGIVSYSGLGPFRVITCSFEETYQALTAQGLKVVKVETLELDEILNHLMHSDEKTTDRITEEI